MLPSVNTREYIVVTSQWLQGEAGHGKPQAVRVDSAHSKLQVLVGDAPQSNYCY